MNYAVLRIQDFALHALRRSEPALAGRPVALIAGEGRKAVLTEVSPEAAGIVPGFTVTLAMARCPGIILRTRDPLAEVEAQRLLLAAAFTLAPRVEATAAGCCTVDLQGAQPDRTEAAVHFAKWMNRSGAEIIAACDVIVPVPLHRWRLLKRAYNQSALLANALGRVAGKPVAVDALVRIKATPTQGGLDRQARRRNVAKAFASASPVKIAGKRVLLVDDVYTTGATVEACTDVLLNAGAQAVDVLVLARVPALVGAC